jgi:hypothetical protein
MAASRKGGFAGGNIAQREQKRPPDEPSAGEVVAVDERSEGRTDPA